MEEDVRPTVLARSLVAWSRSVWGVSRVPTPKVTKSDTELNVRTKDRAASDRLNAKLAI